jgi:hypothetical protein
MLKFSLFAAALVLVLVQVQLCSGFKLQLRARPSWSMRSRSMSVSMSMPGEEKVQQVGQGWRLRMPPLPKLESKHLAKMGALMLLPLLLGAPSRSGADDELAKYAAEGNKVGVDGQCFIKKCALETSSCANDPNCLKGLSCLAR